MNGLRTAWEKGPRELVEAVDNRGKTITRLGKKGGPVIKQRVVKCLIPKVRP